METTTQRITKIICTYARVSTERQEKEGTVENQKMAMKEFAAKNGYTIVREYTDDGWSGDNIIRPELDHLRQDAKEKIWEAVLIYDPDRLARRAAWQELVMEELKDKNIETLFVTVPPPKSDEDVIMQKMRGVFSEYEKMKIRERFRLGKLRKAKEGHIVGHEAPFGYTYIKPEEGEKFGYYVINEDEAKIVKMIFHWVADEKLTLRTIVKKLQEMGIMPRESKRGVWNTSTLSTMLKRKTYIGESHYLRSCAVLPQNPINKQVYKKNRKTSRKLRPESEWIKIKTPVIIDDDLYKRAQKALSENFDRCKRNRKNQYLLAGLIYCKCGRRRTGEGSQGGKNLYYRCTDRTHCFPLARSCYSDGINAQIADREIWQGICEFMSTPELILAQGSKWLNDKATRTIITVESRSDIEKKMARVKVEEDRLVKIYMAGTIPEEVLNSNMKEIRDKMSHLQGKLAECVAHEKGSDTPEMPTKEVIGEFCQRMKIMLEYLNFEERSEIVRDLINRIEGDRDELSVEGCITIENKYAEFKTINRNCGFAECWQVYIV